MMLERAKKLELGVSPNHAFTAWTKMTGPGMFLAAFGTIFMMWTVVSFFWLGWKIALLSIVLLATYSAFMRSIARSWFRKRLLIYTDEFHELYCAGHVTIRVTLTGEILQQPEDWTARVEKML